jgi:hypothetical protein
MIIQIIFQFIPQVFAVFAIRMFRKEIEVPFRMWLYPLPALIALVGWIYVGISPDQRQNIGTALILMVMGVAAYGLRAKFLNLWPLEKASRSATGHS